MAQTQIISKFDEKTATRAQFIAHVRELRATIDRLTEQLDEYANIAADYYWQYQVRSNKTLQGATKPILEAVPDIIGKKPVDENGFARVYVAEIERATGLSRTTVSNGIARLNDSGILEYKLEHNSDSEGGVHREMYLRIPPQTRENPAPLVLLPAMDKKSGERKGLHGGNRVKMCKHCHSIDLHIVCKGCGSVLADDDIIEMTPMEYQEQVVFDAEIKEIEAAKEAEAAAAGYPDEIKAMLDAMETFAPTYACFECQTENWLPALEDGEWGYKCGMCRPFLLTSQGRDLRKRETNEHE